MRDADSRSVTVSSTGLSPWTTLVGIEVGRLLGCALGILEGLVGLGVGAIDGSLVGEAVGS